MATLELTDDGDLVVLRSSNFLPAAILNRVMVSSKRSPAVARHVRGPLARGLCDRPQSRGLFDASIGDRFGHRNLKLGLLVKMDTDEILSSAWLVEMTKTQHKEIT